MDVELHDDRRLGPDDRPDRLEDLPLAVVNAFRDHRTVEVEEYAIERERASEPFRQLAEQFVEHCARSWGARERFGEHRRHDVDPCSSRLLQEPADRRVRAGERVYQLVASHEVERSVVVERRRDRRERARLVTDPTDTDAQGGLLVAKAEDVTLGRSMQLNQFGRGR